MFPHRRLRRPGPKRLNCRTCRRRSSRRRHRRWPSGSNRSMRSTPRRRQRAILPRSRNRLQTRDLHPPLRPQSTDDADHTLALAMIVFAAIAISGSVLEVTRWLSRRKASNRREFEWAISNTLYQRARASLDFDLRTPARHIPPPKPLGQAERLAQDLQQILNELQTRPYVSQSAPSDLPRSSWPPVATATRLDHMNIRAS